jgi:nucleoside-diphosphate-sugar epimerase
MVIGKGMIAQEFENYRDNDQFIIFASGVSDSTHAPAAAFTREENLLKEAISSSDGRRLVYFSTCSIYDQSMSGSPYVQHKKRMEELIVAKQSDYTIFRLSNPVGKTNNTNTVVNFFIRHIIDKTAFTVWKNASRNIIDIDDMFLVCNDILQTNSFLNEIVTIANPHNYPVPFIVETIEKHFHTKANYTLVAKGDEPHIDISQVSPLFKKFNINFDDNYLLKLLQKYFPA